MAQFRLRGERLRGDEPRALATARPSESDLSTSTPVSGVHCAPEPRARPSFSCIGSPTDQSNERNSRVSGRTLKRLASRSTVPLAPRPHDLACEGVRSSAASPMWSNTGVPPDDPNAHSASIEVPVSAEAAFAFMSDGLKQDHWALGSLNRRALGDNLFVGQSSFDGADLYVKIQSYAELLLVDYLTGHDPNRLLPAVEARIRRGEWLGRDPSVSVITLTLWKWASATDEDWRLHYHLWRTEMHLIKGALVRGL